VRRPWLLALALLPALGVDVALLVALQRGLGVARLPSIAVAAAVTFGVWWLLAALVGPLHGDDRG